MAGEILGAEVDQLASRRQDTDTAKLRRIVASCGIERWGQRAGKIAMVLRKHPVVVSRWVSDNMGVTDNNLTSSTSLELQVVRLLSVAPMIGRRLHSPSSCVRAIGNWIAPDGVEYMGYSVRTDRYRYTEWVNWETRELAATELRTCSGATLRILGARPNDLTISPGRLRRAWLARVRLRLQLRRDSLRSKLSLERKLVGRPGLEPGTTGLKVHWELNGHGTFQHPPSPILARLTRVETRPLDHFPPKSRPAWAHPF